MGICFSFCDSKQKEGDKEGRRRFYFQSHSDFVLFPSNQLNSYQRRKLIIMAAGTDQAHFVHQVADKSDFENQLKDAGSKLVVVDFFASWCGPCQKINPAYIQLARKYPNALFLGVDLDRCRETAIAQNRALHSFIFYRNGTKIDQMKGVVDANGLETMIKKHYGGDSAEGPPGFQDLQSFIEQKGCECLNESDSTPFKSFLEGKSATATEPVSQEELKAGMSRASALVLHEHTTFADLRNEIDDDERLSAQLFLGKKFQIVGIDEEVYGILLHQDTVYERVEEAVKSVGGIIVQNDHDFCLLPAVYSSLVKKNYCPLFTEHWLFDCLDQNSTEIELKYYHIPKFAVNKSKGILKDVVIAISSYSASERTYIGQLASFMGIKVQDALVKKKDDYLPTTHLITNSLDNEKAKAAGRWKIPVVTYKWIIDCYRASQKMNTVPYLTSI